MIDKESQEFIDWALKQDLKQVMSQVVEDLDNYFQIIPLEEFRQALKEKLQDGAREHGPLKTSLEVIKEELTKEVIDLVGWTLMWIYVEGKNG